jgi:hypothetical protein
MSLLLISVSSFGQTPQTNKCKCKKSVKEVMLVEQQFISGDVIFSHKGSFIMYDNGTTNSPTPNKHITYLNKCTDHTVELDKEFCFLVTQNDIDLWKKYLESNCNEVFKRKYKPLKQYHYSDPENVNVKVKVK